MCCRLHKNLTDKFNLGTKSSVDIFLAESKDVYGIINVNSSGCVIKIQEQKSNRLHKLIKVSIEISDF